MNESLLLFESVVNSRWFLRTSIILLLNKVDIFKDTLNKVLFLLVVPVCVFLDACPSFVFASNPCCCIIPHLAFHFTPVSDLRTYADIIDRTH